MRYITKRISSRFKRKTQNGNKVEIQENCEL